jgi:glycosyltransferase involved in cell wall biosynthesis
VPETVPIAFYAPMKSPDHPAPSGDRTMARLLLKALGRAGFGPELASQLQTRDGLGNADVQADLRCRSLVEADRLLSRWSGTPSAGRPRLWFTYHVYYKAPDWIGPRVADGLRIPYVVAEGSRAGKRAGSAWDLSHRGAEAALDRADAIFVMTQADREALERHRAEGQRLLDLPPFVDLEEWSRSAVPRRGQKGIVRLLTVAMMRPGDKLTSYRILADALAGLPEHRAAAGWTLDVVGDGEARGEVEALFARFSPRITFRGRLDDREALRRLYAAADLLVWPAVNEAYGMAFLEAQAHGCPVLAGAYGGVASVVRHDETGFLTPPGDETAFGEALRSLLPDAERRRRLGRGAQHFVETERGLDQAAARLTAGLLPLLAGPHAP